MEVLCPQIELFGERVGVFVGISFRLPAERRPAVELHVALVVDYQKEAAVPRRAGHAKHTTPTIEFLVFPSHS